MQFHQVSLQYVCATHKNFAVLVYHFIPLDEGHPEFVINEVISEDVVCSSLARTPAEARSSQTVLTIVKI